jgi:hypothetical protein
MCPHLPEPDFAPDRTCWMSPAPLLADSSFKRSDHRRDKHHDRDGRSKDGRHVLLGIVRHDLDSFEARFDHEIGPW